MRPPFMQIAAQRAAASPRTHRQPAGCVNCPFCGPRPQSEFEPIREPDAAPALDAPASIWFRTLYTSAAARPAPQDAGFWRHTDGCGMVMVRSGDDLRPATALHAQALQAPALQPPAPRKRAKRARRQSSGRRMAS
ncbi:MAG: sarcosine oxidase subunit delta [Neomegalonema sp.]|nr:sarcosine oxidase subunit delta [Neomegalonema sp.]